MKRRTLRFLAAGAVFLLLLAGMTARLTRVLSDKFAYKYHGEFYEREEQYDVLLFGSSHMMNSLLPLEMFEERGIRAFNLGMTNESLAASYWRLRDALNRCTPQVVVVEASMVTFGRKVDTADPNAMALLHNSLDSMPLGAVKVQAVTDLFGAGDLENIFQYLVPLAVCHNRWYALTEDDFHPWQQADRGALPIRNLYMPESEPLLHSDGQAEPPAVGREYLTRILTLCEQRGVPVVLLNVPYFTQEHDLQVFNALPELTAGYKNVRCINLFQTDFADWRGDFSDAAGHLNTAAAARLSRWLANDLAEFYQLPDHRGEDGAQRWEQDMGISTLQHWNKLLGAADLNTALMLADHTRLACRVRLGEEALQNEQTALLAGRLPDRGEPPPGSPDLPEEGCALLVWRTDSDEPAVLLQY